MNGRTLRSLALGAAIALGLAAPGVLAAQPHVGQPHAAHAHAASPGGATQLVNINSADAGSIAEALAGIGPAKAEAIVAYRKAHGPFKSVEQLREVQGVSAKTLERNRGRIQLK